MAQKPVREPLTEQRLLDAALRLVDEGGMEALSMRRLGAALGVDPMAVYYHLPNKRALVRRLVESVFAGLQTPEASGPWRERVKDWAMAYRALALAHPNLVLQIVADPEAVATAAVRANETLYATLEESGLPPAAIVGGADLIVDYVNGFVLGEAAYKAPDKPPRSLVQEIDEGPSDAYPVQRRILSQLPNIEARDSFAFGLDLIIVGLEAKGAS